MRIRHLIIIAAFCCYLKMNAHDFSATIDGQQIFFEITNKGKKTAQVTYNGNIADKNHSEVNGMVKIPAKVKHEDTVYEITGIGPKAFANAKDMKGIMIPSGVMTIGDFAFENCDSLKNVVFPGNPVTFGQGTFFNCTGIENVTVGSDWKSIDLTMFRWSNDLKEITIPAKIEQINGIKKLKALRSISVDPNNSTFTSYNGILYSKDGAILIACPRAMEGRVSVNDGTKTISEGSLIDCTAITALDFPASVETLPFRETSRMKDLKYIVMRNEKPISTGYLDGKGKFLFQLGSDSPQIIVAASSQKDYVSNLATDAGEYSETPDGIPYIVAADQLPDKKNIKGVKNFDKY
ncbi:MAG: leucine-rich repeat domain-containing protein [Muribaculaceae bacterium]|nr:leucine-rich repeat domain-containing protein [Muribaculaceae bacterium]